jgi:hypothetical protein
MEQMQLKTIANINGKIEKDVGIMYIFGMTGRKK